MSKPRFKCVLRRVYIPIYGQYLNILVMDDYREAWLALFPEADCIPGEGANGSGWFGKGEGFLAIRRDATAGTVAHEASHITNDLMHYVGMKHDSRNQEPQCYLLGWIVDQVEAARKEKPTYHAAT